MDKRDDFAELLYSTYFDGPYYSHIYEVQMDKLRLWIKLISLQNFVNIALRGSIRRCVYNDQLRGSAIFCFNDPRE